MASEKTPIVPEIKEESRKAMVSFQTATATVTGTLSDISWTQTLKLLKGSFDGVTFTATEAGQYIFYGALHMTGSALSTNQIAEIVVFKNVSTRIASADERVTGGTAWTRVNVSGTIDLQVGDTIKFQTRSTIPTPSIANVADSNSGYIIKVGEL